MNGNSLPASCLYFPLPAALFLLGHRVHPSSPSSTDFDLLVFRSLINCDSWEPDYFLNLVNSLNMFVEQNEKKETFLVNENACTSELL